MIEKDKPGGTCLNIGCIPSKAIIHQAELFNSLPELKKLGIATDLTNFSYEKIYQKAQKAATILSKGILFLFKKHNIELKFNKAVIHNEHEVKLDDDSIISGKHILIATGSRPKSLPNIKINEKNIISSTGALMLKDLPEKILIVGGGAIGIEFAYIFNSFQVQVYIVEILNNILPTEDTENIQILKNNFSRRGIKIFTSTKITNIKSNDNTLTISIKNNGNSETIEVNKILLAAGREPNTSDIGLENIEINTNHQLIPVNDFYQTKISSIYAVGDIIKSPQLAHVASKEGIIAVEHIAGKTPKKIDLYSIPGAIYCEPQIASFGKTEDTLIKNKIKFKKTIFPYAGCGKATTIGKREGQVKILYSTDKKEILGAHIIGESATELIHELLIIKEGNLKPENISRIIFAHPTFSEIILDIMRKIDGWSIHV